MPRQLHSAPAAAAITFVLCVASFSFVVFVLLPAVSVYPHGITVRPVSVEARNIARAVGMVLLLGYSAGVFGWIAAFALRRDGMHRLASVLNHSGK